METENKKETTNTKKEIKKDIKTIKKEQERAQVKRFKEKYFDYYDDIKQSNNDKDFW